MANPASRASQDLPGAPGSPAAPASAQYPADLAALTGRDDFLLELGEVLGGRASVHPADSIETAIEQLSHARHNRLLVIDARDTGEVRANVERAAEKVPGAAILVFAEAQAEKEIAAALKGTKVFAVLPVPMEQAKTAAVLDAALSDADRIAAAHQRVTLPAAGAPAAQAPQAMRSQRPLRPQASPTPAEPARGWILWAGVGAAVLAAAGGVTWYLMHGKTPVPAAAPGHAAVRRVTGHVAPLAQPVVDTSIVQGHVDDLLEKARRAMFDRHFTTPKGANALVYYRSVLAVDPTNGEALDGLRRVGNVLTSRFHDAMSRAQFPLAALALATLKVAWSADPSIASFQRQLSEAEISQALAAGQPDRAAALLTQAAQAGVPAAQLSSWQARLTQLQQSRQTQSLTAQIEERIRADDFTGAGSALARLRTLAPAAPVTRRAARELTNSLLAKAVQAAQAGNNAAGSRWLAEARANGASADDIAAAEKRLAGAQARAARLKVSRLLALANARLESGALTLPAGDNAAHYLRAAESAHPSGADLSAEERARGELASKLLARAESDAHAGNGAAAQADVAQARQWGATAAEIRSATGTIGVSLRQAAQPTAADIEQLAAGLVRVRYVAPSYPDYALEQRISGQVTVRYVIDKKGIPRQLRVIAAQPVGVFNRAALDAIRAWRYKPVRFHGQPVEVPVRALIRFVLPN